MGTNTTRSAKSRATGEELTFYPTLLNETDITNKPTLVKDGDIVTVGSNVKFTIKFIK